MTRTNDKNQYLSDPELIVRLKAVYFGKLKQHQDFDDFYHDYVVHTLEGFGAHQTLDQYGIDWLRKKTFYNRKRKVAPQFTSIEDLYKPIKDTEDQSHLGSGYIGIVKELAQKYQGKTRVVVFLYYLYGCNQKEIGFVLNVTESRVCQLLTMIKSGRKLLNGEIPDDLTEEKIEEKEVLQLRARNKILEQKLVKTFRESIHGKKPEST